LYVSLFLCVIFFFLVFFCWEEMGLIFGWAEGGGGGDREVQLAEAIVVNTVAAVARVKSVNNTVPNKTAFNNIVGHVTHILG